MADGDRGERLGERAAPEFERANGEKKKKKRKKKDTERDGKRRRHDREESETEGVEGGDNETRRQRQSG